jgi:GAF domain-containing protein
MDGAKLGKGSPQANLNALYQLGQALVLLRDEREIVTTVLEIAEELLDFQDSEFLLVDEAQQHLTVVAQRGELHMTTGLRLLLEGELGITVAAARSGRPLYVPDVRADPRYVYAGFPAVSELAVPVQIEGRLLGVINVESREPDAFTPADVQLLSTLASQAALALENARLYAQERRRVEELASLNHIARRISASLDLRETLDAIVNAAAELVPCVLAEISLWDEERQTLTLQALRCEPKRAFPTGEEYPPGEGYTGWLVRHRRPLLVPDVDARKDIRPDLLPGELPFQAYVGVPLLAADDLIGTLVLIHDRSGAFDEDDLRLLEALAGQAAAAIRNARLYQELSRRHRELAALCSIAETASTTLELQEVMDQAVEKVLEVMETEAAAVRLLDEESGDLTVVSFRGLTPEDVPLIDRLPLREASARHMSQLREPLVVQGPDENPRLADLTFAVAPLRVRDRTVGILGVSTRRQREFTPAELELLMAIAHQLGAAMENATLTQEALEAERLVAVGRVAGTVAHDLRSPLGGIIRSAEFLARPELSDATRQKLSRAVVAMARRLHTTAQEILDYTRGGRMILDLRPCILSSFLDEVLEVLRVDFSDQGIELLTEWGYDGAANIDGDRIAQVVYNIATNARDAMPEGGRLTVSTRRVGPWVELRFTDTGPGVPQELSARIFEPFFSHGKREGAGLGLAIAHRIVSEHGGEIGVESPAGGGATFTVRLPLAEGV